MVNWYYAQDNQKIGPVSPDEIKSLYENKTIGLDTLIWRPGMDQWQPLRNVIQTPQQSAPPPAPPSAPSQPESSDTTDEAADISAATATTEPQDQVSVAAQSTCSECSQSFNADELMQFGDAHICAGCKPVFVQKMREGVSLAGHMEYASFWPRFAAKFIDGLILLAVYGILMFVFFVSLATSENETMQALIPAVIQLISFVVSAAYGTWFVGRFGATPGKMALKLQVIMPDGGKVTYLRALGRHFAEILSQIIIYIGYLMVLWDVPERRTLHDRICDTRVVHRR